jgi:hypothetical protein
MQMSGVRCSLMRLGTAQVHYLCPRGAAHTNICVTALRFNILPTVVLKINSINRLGLYSGDVMCFL